MFSAATNSAFSSGAAKPNTTNTTGTSGGLFGNTNAGSTGFSFGSAANNNTQTAPTASGGLFGNNNNTNTNTNTTNTGFSLGKPASTGFGFNANTNSNTNTANTTSGGLFGKPAAPSGGLFGNNNANNSAPTTGGLFGNKPAAPAASGGLFGSNNTATNNSTGSGGLFGSNNTATNNSATSGGLFGNKPAAPATSGGLFGNNTASATGGSSLFGNTAKPLFGGAQQTTQQTSQPANSSLFGQQNKPGFSFGTAGRATSGNSNTTGFGFGGNNQPQQPQLQPQQPQDHRAQILQFLSPLSDLTKFSELSDFHKNTIKEIESKIAEQIKTAEEVNALKPAHQANVYSVSPDCDFLTTKTKTLSSELEGDVRALEELTRANFECKTDIEICARLIELLKANYTSSLTTVLHDYFKRTVGRFKERIEYFSRVLSEIESVVKDLKEPVAGRGGDGGLLADMVVEGESTVANGSAGAVVLTARPGEQWDSVAESIHAEFKLFMALANRVQEVHEMILELKVLIKQ